MKAFGIVCTLALLLFVMAPSRSVAQNRPDEKPKAQDEAKPQDNQNRDERAKPDDRARQDQRNPQEDRNVRPDEGRQPQEPNADRRDERRTQPEANRPENQQREQRPADNRPAQNMGRDKNQHQAADRGRHIPDDQFRAHFGRQHTFHVRRGEIVNVSQPVIVYGGYSFELIDAWPADWSYDDDCYVDYVDDEYYLFDVMHPGMRIAVIVIG